MMSRANPRSRHMQVSREMSPSHIAFVVTEPADGGGPDSRANWREVGALFPQKSGKGWLLVLHPQISVSGRLVITEKRERPARDGER
jgi:hypothetical protein